MRRGYSAVTIVTSAVGQRSRGDGADRAAAGKSSRPIALGPEVLKMLTTVAICFEICLLAIILRETAA